MGLLEIKSMIKNSFDELNSQQKSSKVKHKEENNLKRKKKKKRQYPEAVELNKWPKFKLEKFKNEKRERGEKGKVVETVAENFPKEIKTYRR